MSNSVAPPTLEDALRALLRADAPAEAPRGLLGRLLDIPDSPSASTRAPAGKRLSSRIAGMAGAGVATLAIAVVGLALARVGPFAGVGMGSAAGHAVAWSTPYAGLVASDFVINAGGRRFTAADVPVDVRSDSGDPSYRTLELTWDEQGVEMRLFLYFAGDSSDWWVSEIRTYDGLAHTTGEWLFYEGPFFRTPLGQTYSGDGELGSTSSMRGVSGHLTLTGLQLRAFSAGAADAPHPNASLRPTGLPVVTATFPATPTSK